MSSDLSLNAGFQRFDRLKKSAVPAPWRRDYAIAIRPLISQFLSQ
jgi:hypothetical protein